MIFQFNLSPDFVLNLFQHRGEGTIPAQQQPRKSKSGVLFGNSNYPGDGEYYFENIQSNVFGKTAIQLGLLEFGKELLFAMAMATTPACYS